MYLTLFDFEINHVPADKHQAPNGLSCWKCSPKDSEEEYLDTFIGSSKLISPHYPESPLLLLSTQYLLPATAPDFASELLTSLMSTIGSIPETAFGVFDSPTSMSTVCRVDIDEDDCEHDELVARIHRYSGFAFDPAFHNPENKHSSLIDHMLLKSTDSMTYTGHEFEHHNVKSWMWSEVSLGNEVCEVEIVSYGSEYMAGLREGVSPPVAHDPHMHPGVSYTPEHPMSRCDYDDIDYKHVRASNIATISHIHGRQEGEPEGLFDNLLCYLKDDILPNFKNAQEQRAFVKCVHSFIIHNGRLWKTEKNGRSPHLVITDKAR